MPRVVAAVAVLCYGSGVLPLEWFGLTEYEIARQVHPTRAPFRPNFHITRAFYLGSDALTGNVPSIEAVPPRTFTTDRLGFRFTPPVSPAPAQIVALRGFSYTWGAYLSDNETLPYLIQRRLGVNVYDAARFHEDPEEPADYDELMATLGLHPRTALYVHLEPNAHELSWRNKTRTDRIGEAILGTGLYGLLSSTQRDVHGAISDWIHTSPFTLTVVQAKKALENNLILPNPRERNALWLRLPDGTRMLAGMDTVDRALHPPNEETVRNRADYIAWWRDQLAQRNTNMLVLLVPEKVSVYGRQLGLPIPEDHLFMRLERELHARGIKVINGLTLLRAHAAEDLRTGQLAYLRLDGHWNQLGVQRFADATAQVLKKDYGF